MKHRSQQLLKVFNIFFVEILTWKFLYGLNFLKNEMFTNILEFV